MAHDDTHIQLSKEDESDFKAEKDEKSEIIYDSESRINNSILSSKDEVVPFCTSKWSTKGSGIIMDNCFSKEETKSELENLVQISNSISERVSGIKLRRENGHEVRNLVQFVNSASYDIKAALDHSSPVTSKESSQIFRIGIDLFPTVTKSRSEKLKPTMPYFGYRDPNVNPLKVLKVEPLNVVKYRETTHNILREHSVTKLGRNFEISNLIPTKKPKVESEEYFDKDVDIGKDTDTKEESRDFSSTSPTIMVKSKTENILIFREEDKRDKQDRNFDNPLPLRKRRLPASFWQEPGKSENHKPAVPSVTSLFHDTAFLPFIPRRLSVGNDSPDLFAANLSASEKLELLRLNCLEREHAFNSYLNQNITRYESTGALCSPFPCVQPEVPVPSRRVSSCINRDQIRLPPSKRMGHYDHTTYHTCHMCSYALPGERFTDATSNLNSGCQPFYSPLGLIHGVANSQFSAPFWTQFSETHQPNQNMVFPWEFSSPSNFSNAHNIVRPVPKKTFSNCSQHLNTIFDVR